MYTKNQLAQAVADFIKNNPSAIVNVLSGKDVKVASLTASAAIDGIEVLIDKNKHLRFLEGNITTIPISGVTFTYAKWSLSGNHLMIVVAGSVANGTALTGTDLASIAIPSWIGAKIFPTWDVGYIENKSVPSYANDWSVQNLPCLLSKISNTELKIYLVGNVTMTDTRGFRITYDLLIDDE